MINFFYKVSNFFIKDELNFIQCIKMILNNEGKEIGNINYIFCNDSYILKINQKYLKKNYYTDVISFDSSNSSITNKKIITHSFVSGDIFISIDRVRDNANKWHELFQRELYRVMIHAILHLIGYNDQKITDKIYMNKKEEFYLILF
ncbi:rRNA maturation RNase YbeY [Blattabacterium cuenoti]|uniref:rRNA maturation RNase YbeY n=1 Tax=Blattabacterium cuenoti TaxID=1653831 RepID=UPI00163C9EFA|nr:rRNA maturation RNase YbeY [Blattabacterium cuenoti]